MERLEEYIAQRISEAPDEVSLVYEGGRWTRSEFAAIVDGCREKLVEAGFTSGQRIVTMLQNSPAVLALSVAVWQLGGAIVPLNVKVGVDMLSGALRLVDPFVVVMTPIMKDLVPFVESCEIPVATVSPEGDLESFIGRTGRPESRDLAVIFATSGTTGLPKAVPITHGNLLDNVLKVKSHVKDLRDKDVALNVLPNFHTFGFCLSGILPLVLGYRQVILPSFLPPSKTVETIYKEGITVLIVVPTIISIICEVIARSKMSPPPALNMIVCGGAPLDSRLHMRAREYLGLPIFEGYGLTECSPIVGAAHDSAALVPGLIGPVMDGYETQIRDRDGNIIDDNEGILWVRGPSVASGYFRSPDAMAKRFDSDGWFNTGDVVRFEDDGYIRILDRDTDIIIVGGFNVYPQEVEATLMECDSVREVAVVGTPNGLSGELPKAFVVIAEGVDKPEPKELVSFCKSKLSHYKVPRKIEFIDELPRSSIGKVLRRTLRDLERQRYEDRSH